MGNSISYRITDDAGNENYFVTLNHIDIAGLTVMVTDDKGRNMLTMPHLQLMSWDYKGNFVESRRTGSTYSIYYCYDSEGNRVRKVTLNGATREERIYIGNYEVYRKTISGVLDTERQSRLYVARCSRERYIFIS